MRTLSTLFVILLVALHITGEGYLSRFPNIGYLGSTYNIFKGNPHSTKGLDPGFTLRNLYQFSYNGVYTTADGRYLIPDNTRVVQSSACNFQFASTVLQNTASYFDSLKVDVSASFSGWGASFSASADYKDVHQGSTAEQKRYVSSQAKCEVYLASVQNTTMNQAFVNAVKNLPVNMSDSATEYIDFFNTWGTHVAIQLRMGGRFGYQSSFTGSQYTSMVASGLDVSASAGYSGFVSVDAKAATDIQKKQAQEFESYREDYQIYQVGGATPQNENTTSFEWAQTVLDNPLPISYRILPLASFLKSIYFPDDQNITAKHDNVQNAVVKYCQSLDLADTGFCNNDPSVNNTIPAMFLNTYINSKLECDHVQSSLYLTVQFVVDATQFILGTLLSLNLKSNQPVLVVKHSDSKLIQEASSWNSTCDSNSLCIYEPTCSDGFSAVSDFVCCSKDTEDCLVSLPRAMPCIADKCLQDCGYDPNLRYPFNNGNLQPISYGNPQFGNSYNSSSPQFFKYVPNGSGSNPKCLDFNCIHYIQ